LAERLGRTGGVRPQQIEAWAYSVIEQTLAGHRPEDSRVELKTKWPEPARMARWLAGHANAAQGAALLWLIGVDEKTPAVPGTSPPEMSDWWAQVEAQFDERHAPTMAANLTIGYEGRVVAVLLFETDRAPYVVVNPDGGAVSRDVPFRRGNSTRSATRADLLRLLVPLQELPTLEGREGFLILRSTKDEKERTRWLWVLRLHIYTVPHGGAAIVLPHHQVSAAVRLGDTSAGPVEFESVSIGPVVAFIPSGRPHEESTSLTISKSMHETFIHGPGMLALSASARRADRPKNVVLGEGVTVTFRARPAGSHVTGWLETTMAPAKPEQDTLARWEAKPGPTVA
jgi:hypothetical protein